MHVKRKSRHRQKSYQIRRLRNVLFHAEQHGQRRNEDSSAPHSHTAQKSGKKAGYKKQNKTHAVIILMPAANITAIKM